MKEKIKNMLQKTEKYTQTDMVYLTKNISWIGIGKVISSAASLVLVYVFGNFVSANDYGTYQYIISIAGLLATPTLSGMNTAITKAVAQGFDGTIKEGLRIKIKWGLLSAIGSIGAGAYYLIQGNQVLGLSFIGIAILLPFMDSFSIFASYVEGKKDFKKATWYGSIISIVRVATLISIILITKNIILITVSYFAITTLVRGLILFFILKKENLNDAIDQKAISYGKHLSFMKILSNGIVSLDNILLFQFLGATQLAVYSFAKAPITKISSMLTPISTLAYPKFAETSVENLKQTLPKKLFLFLFLMIAITIVYIIAAPFLFSIVLPEYMDSVIYSQIFAISLIFLPQKIAVSALTAHHQKRALYIINIINPIIRIVALIFLLPLFGIMGVIISFLLGLLFNGIASFYYFFKMKV
ncbi:oligosaccharide flippase family protein [Candidatus Nomurabacteria bacterium]|nr:oligosaccharide flippase family protein [Candidatus Nomurabacteria bacterium]USN94565.1 MAG: oligosaccharide flippase family protein [Candidatus Nomurabacteria bacterium]